MHVAAISKFSQNTEADHQAQRIVHSNYVKDKFKLKKTQVKRSPPENSLNSELH